MLTRLSWAAVAAIALAAPAIAAGPLQISSRILVERRVAQPDGTTRIEQKDAARAVPGDRVDVVVSYRNTGTAALGGVVISNPVPRGLAFRGSTGAAAEVSADGRSFAPLANLTVPATAGGKRPARADDVVAVRWRLAAPLPPGAAGQFSFAASIK